MDHLVDLKFINCTFQTYIPFLFYESLFPQECQYVCLFVTWPLPWPVTLSGIYAWFLITGLDQSMKKKRINVVVTLRSYSD